jgi:hypothetical protein
MSLLNGSVRLLAILLVPCLIYTLRAGLAAQPEQLSLASGKQVPLLSETRTGSSGTGLLVRYQTDISFDQPSTTALSQEADQILKVVQQRPLASGCTQIVVNVNEAPHGSVLSTSRNRSFIFDKDSNGSWQQEGVIADLQD